MEILRVTGRKLAQLVPLFDGYRVFYRQHSNPDAAREFLTKRLQLKDSVIFMARDHSGNAIGFTQLYPSFYSVSMQRTYILNDLFVMAEGRGKGFGAALLLHAQAFAQQMGAKGLTLETETHNPAQKLYERLGWIRDTEVYHYTWTGPIEQ